MSGDVTRGLPADLAAVLRDQSVIVPQDAAVFELIAAWAKAPAATATAAITIEPDTQHLTPARWQRCPVCDGRGLCVPVRAVPRERTCRTCRGHGIVGLADGLPPEGER